VGGLLLGRERGEQKILQGIGADRRRRGELTEEDRRHGPQESS
jgi:hypothetical protein